MRSVLPLLLLGACWANEPREPSSPTPHEPLVAKPGPPPMPHEVRGAGDAPSIEMPQALALAKKFADQHNVHFDRQYLQGAVFDAGARQWVFDWQTPSAKGGLTIITVHESGEISINYGE